MIVLEGQPAQFKTQVTPKSPKPTVQWYREGALIPQSPDFQVRVRSYLFHNQPQGFQNINYQDSFKLQTIRISR